MELAETSAVIYVAGVFVEMPAHQQSLDSPAVQIPLSKAVARYDRNDEGLGDLAMEKASKLCSHEFGSFHLRDLLHVQEYCAYEGFYAPSGFLSCDRAFGKRSQEVEQT